MVKTIYLIMIYLYRKSVIVPALSKRAGQVFQRAAILVAWSQVPPRHRPWPLAKLSSGTPVSVPNAAVIEY